jgi:membrane-bound serine protease (ClpP class)
MMIPIVLVLVGLGFVLAEVFFPSLGVFGLLAGTCILAADWMAFQEGPIQGWSFVIATIVLVPLVITQALRVLPQTRFGKRMYLAGPVTEGGPAVPDHHALIGQAGVAMTDLRPAGTVRVGDARVSVVALGGFLDAGTPVVVAAVEGTEIKVRRAAVESADTP